MIADTPEKEGLLLEEQLDEEVLHLQPRKAFTPRHKFAIFLIATSSVLLCTLLYVFNNPGLDFTSVTALRRTHLRQYGGKERTDVQVAMMMDRPNREFCRSLFSILANGYEPPHLLNYNGTSPHFLNEKIYKASSFLASRHDEKELFIFIDGFDVWMQLPGTFLVDRYRQLDASVVLGVEKHCYPVSDEICKTMPQSDLPKDAYGPETDRTMAHTRPRFLNTGVILGTVGSLKHVYAEGLKQIEVTEGKVRNDQTIMSQIFVKPDALERYNESFAFDHRQTISMQMYESFDDVTWEIGPNEQSPSSALHDDDGLLKLDLTGMKSSRFWKALPVARNKIYNSVPVLLHFNGSKTYLKASMWWTNFWFSQQSLREVLQTTFAQDGAEGKAGAWNGQEWLSWNSLCGLTPIY